MDVLIPSTGIRNGKIFNFGYMGAKREVLHRNLIECDIIRKEVRLIKMCLNETCR
jgi:hypothetical protein